VAEQPSKLAPEQVEAQLKSVPEWGEVGEAIQRTYTFKDFVTSLAFVQSVAQHAEAVQHHPDIMIRYSKVTLTLSTHDAGGITDKDFESARKADAFASMFPGPAPKPVSATSAGGKKKK